MMGPLPVLPRLALSVRQPWAWAIVHAGKDIENRTRAAIRHNLDRRQRVAIHAAKGMTKAEYYDGARVKTEIFGSSAFPADLRRGGIIGSIEITGSTDRSENPWFFGPVGLTLARPEPALFVPALGWLGIFEWTAAGDDNIPEPAKWMVRRSNPESESVDSPAPPA
ncbi:MAG: hypothetical protein QNJ44_18030 [Rhodobacter sp.]|nr:hypothetical protein [Rhodobacter sp.]